MDELELELKRGFLEEATQLLDETEQLFLSLQEKGADEDTLNGMFRMAHNLKGTSQAVGFAEIGEFTHKLENVILKLKNKELAVSDNVIDVLLACNDRVRYMIEELTKDLTASFDNSELIERLLNIDVGPIPGESEESATPVEEEAPLFEDAPLESIIASDENIEMPPDANLFDEPPQETPSPEMIAEEDSSTPVAEEFSPAPMEMDAAESESVPAAAAAAAAAKPEQKTSASPVKLKIDESIRVSVDRLDKLNNLVGELVILESMIRSSTVASLDGESVRSITQLGKLSKDIQDVTMSLRMLPIKPTLKKMHRVVRDVSMALHKKVNLTFIGEETEVDKTMIENLTDPLTHIVRNAVDHGIEDADGRKQVGKSEVAEVVIRCFHEGNNLVIEVSDDGKGIDHEKIRQIAISKGILRPNQDMSPDQIIQLIFHPGFSTKSEVSEISGRGVGMDVVKTNIEGMSGRVQVKTAIGSGSTFRIELPLTMAVIEGMILNHGSHRYVVPLNQVHETLQPESKNIHSITGVGEVMVVRGEKIAVAKLDAVLGMKVEPKKPEEQTAIILQSQKGSLAVFVDEITGRQQVVIKKIDNQLNRKNLFIGSSILGDGLPSLIVDLHQILEMSVSRREAKSA